MMAIECKHGRLARKCELCELDDANDRIRELEAERIQMFNLIKAMFVVQSEVPQVWLHCGMAWSEAQAFLASIGGEGKNGD